MEADRVKGKAAGTVEEGVAFFDHSTTNFSLEGSHKGADCRGCHASMVFEEADTDCMSCHTDVHAQSVGADCARCHNTTSWLVDDIPELHEENGFPLIGPHDVLSCVDCHLSETQQRFDRIGNDCVQCHRDDYLATTSPNHQMLGFSTNCLDCHPPLSDTWETDQILHNFFPLVGGHDIQDCAACHLTDNFSDASPECVSCHQTDFDNTVDPDHRALGFPTDCAACHTIDPGWQPAIFQDHDALHFPIYSGSHAGEWNACMDCHPVAGDFTVFTCVACHTNPVTDNEHGGISGYVYEDNACLACHPTGSAEDGFNHDNTNFPLRGGHVGVDCNECHANGFAGTPTDCFACHEDDFNNTSSPNHAQSQFSTNCIQCHTESAWQPATFDHDGMYFPIYSGNHNNEWNQCSDCHFNANDYSLFSCIDCHEHDDPNDLADEHDEVNGYQYESNACFACHPNGN
jgi:Zn finger protein HypA/HybF involved in hydrogenase expression